MAAPQLRDVHRQVRFVNNNEGTTQMIVIGVDVHKRTHTLVAVRASTGVIDGQLTFAATDAGQLQAMLYCSGLDQDRVWAIEDCRGLSQRLERALIAAGEQVVRVAAMLMGTPRRAQRQPGKSDPIDALAVARAVVRDGVDQFPAAYLDEDAMEIRLLHDHREQLITERSHAITRLRWHLVNLDPVLEAQIPLRGLDQPVTQAKVRRRLAGMPQTARVRIARQRLNRIAELSRHALELHAELDQLTTAHHPALRQEPGCGPVIAAILNGQTAGAKRFAPDAKFARQAGVAPIPASSGKTQRHPACTAAGTASGRCARADALHLNRSHSLDIGASSRPGVRWRLIPGSISPWLLLGEMQSCRSLHEVAAGAAMQAPKWCSTWSDQGVGAKMNETERDRRVAAAGEEAQRSRVGGN